MLLVVIGAALGLLGVDRSARAQSPDAEALFNQGNELMEQGHVEQACEAFEASNRVEPTAGTLIQLGKCLLRGDRIASAWMAYKGASSRAKDPAKRKFAEGNVAALEPRLSYLTVSVSDENRLEELTIGCDGTPLDPANWNRALPMDGNDYVIEAHAPGHRAWQTTVHVAVERDRVVVEVPHLEAQPTPMASNSSPGATPPVPLNRIRPSPESPQHSRLSTMRKVAIGLGGASVVALTTGAALGAVAQREHSNASRLCPGAGGRCANSAQANVLVRAGNRWAVDANVALSIAGAAAVASGVMWLIGAPSETTGTQISVVPAVASGVPSVFVVRRSSW